MFAAEWRWHAGCLTFIPISCMGPKHATKHTYLIFQPILLVHLHVVQIWIMHIKHIENSVNAQKCPSEPRTITENHTTLMLFYVDTRKKIESNKRQWILFRPQRWDVPYRKLACLLWEALVCGKHIPKPGTNGTKFVPRHVDAAPWYHAKFHEFQTSFGCTRI